MPGRWRKRRITPSAVHPEPQRRIAPDVHLEDIRTSLRELTHGVRRVGGRRHHGRLVNHPVAAVWSGRAKTGTTGAPVRIASAASIDVVAAGRSKKST